MAKSFYQLDIWKNGYKLLLEVYKVTAKYPHEEKYGLTSDTRRAANSIIANIAESHGRYYFADKVRVLYQARGELEETQSHLKVANGLNYLADIDFQKLDREYEGLTVGVNYYIKSIVKQKKGI